MAGAFGNSLLFIGSLLIATVLTAGVLAYTAYHFLVVVTDTAAGIDRIRWPSELMIDWILPGLRTLGTVAVLLAPAGIALRVFGDAVLPAEPALRTVAVIVGWMWLALPVGMLSAISTGSPFGVVRLYVLWGLLRKLPALVVVYVVSAPGMVAVVAFWVVSLAGSQAYLIPVAATLTAWGVLVYARLIGRLGWLIGEREATLPRKVAPAKPAPPKATAAPRPAGKPKAIARKQIQVTDPWAVPPAAPPRPEKKLAKKKRPAVPPVESYGLADDAPCRPPRLELIRDSPFLEVHTGPPAVPTEERPPGLSRFLSDDDEDDGRPIQVRPDTDPAPPPKPQLDVAPSALDLRLAGSDDGRTVPTFPLVSGIYNFPLYATSRPTLLGLTFAWLALGGMWLLPIILFPFR